MMYLIVHTDVFISLQLLIYHTHIYIYIFICIFVKIMNLQNLAELQVRSWPGNRVAYLAGQHDPTCFDNGAFSFPD
jgi:hypothetical protein